MCGRLRVGKGFLHVCSIGRCSHVFGLLVRHTWPLAIMPSADQVPVKSTHSTMRWHKWVVLIAGSTGSASVSYTHLRAHETVLDLVCRLLLEKKKKSNHSTSL